MVYFDVGYCFVGVCFELLVWVVLDCWFWIDLCIARDLLLFCCLLVVDLLYVWVVVCGLFDGLICLFTSY